MTALEIRDLGLSDKNAGCACCAPTGHAHAAATQPATQPATDAATVSTYFVEGMTCSHCIRSVTEELTAIPGVADVTVDLNVGGVSRVRVASETPLDGEKVREAIEEAGYQLASAP